MALPSGGNAGQSGTSSTTADANRGTAQPRTALLTLEPLGMIDLPPHDELRNVEGSKWSLRAFIGGLFADAIRGDWGKHAGTYEKKGTPDVQKFKSEEQSGTWFGRKSLHANADVTWKELDYVLRHNHSLNEKESTPEVFDCNVVLRWEPQLIRDAMVGTGYKEIEMNIIQMYHKMPFPLLPRVFTLLVLAAVEDLPDQPSRSIIVQVPVDVQVASQVGQGIHHDLRTKKYQLGPSENTTSIPNERKKYVGKPIVEGVYTSVEIFSLIHPADGSGEVTEWAMRTLSNAKGVLPVWLQNFGIHGKICKDPEYVIGFIQCQRKSNSARPVS
ncbi:hypothetical protein P154DRAFT_94212 [Amniculicola lignicola CBS 123094]|uniref:DUF3074 domain-containing protein n=1 Tax=Amniculicola lignicola CBS 123094 TaxID=1392246 RepID=A0A6A5WTE2_9PLEO|nr:hypothetical protein P154DRAFT_94212 [Amniculicola lignicola CBS 123094]